MTGVVGGALALVGATTPLVCSHQAVTRQQEAHTTKAIPAPLNASQQRTREEDASTDHGRTNETTSILVERISTTATSAKMDSMTNGHNSNSNNSK
ncbi:hypothetical protein PHYBOEH_008357 [Phytophthora boehmeriae]|uniref:Secreted protein n=1 Tax=Phytophthora boehmeriae TaxID=109152 RepID=A0A8T1W4W2_9STRA|nr:hypothetical protein PHYBOEH_008357 [Phytophthora boehmeriae]